MAARMVSGVRRIPVCDRTVRVRECGQSGHTPLVYTAACHAARRDPGWTMPDALYRGRVGCSSLLGVVELVVVLIVVLVLIVAIR